MSGIPRPRSVARSPSDKNLKVTKADKKAAADAVAVCVRIRPLNRLEKRTNQSEAWHVDRENQALIQIQAVIPAEQASRRGNAKVKDSMVCSFDHIFDQSFDNHQVFDDVGLPIIESCMRGYHACIFAYGQTSAGKTYTIHGSAQQPGMIPLSVDHLFNHIECNPNREFVLRVSYMEIYNEIINDLLAPENTNLRVREDLRTGVFVAGLKEDVVMSADQVFSLLHAGASHRHVGRTNYNDVSSRSHTIFRLVVESSPLGEYAKGGVRTSALNIVDLAGSENAVKAGSGARIKETGYINKSLLTLGHVIYKLSEGDNKHIPFRDSKLTRILQTSLGGRAKVAVVCNISPSSGNVEETISTLKFAMRAKKIENDVKINEKMDGATLLKKYRDEIGQLKEALQKAKEDTEKLRVEHEQKKEADTRKILRDNQQEKSALEAKIEQLTRLILVSADAPKKTALSPQSLADAAGKPAGSPGKPFVRRPPAFTRRPSMMNKYGTAPTNLGAMMEVMKRRNSLNSLTDTVPDVDQVTGGEHGEDDLLCSPAARNPTPIRASVLGASIAEITDVKELQSRLQMVVAQLAASQREQELLTEANKQLREDLEEKDALLQEWDSFYVEQNNKMNVVQDQVRRVALRTEKEGGQDELNTLFETLGMEDEWDAPLVDVLPRRATVAKPGEAQPDHARKESAKFHAIMDRFKGMQQD